MGKKISKNDLKKIKMQNTKKNKLINYKTFGILLILIVVIAGALIIKINNDKVPDKETYLTIAGEDFTQTEYSFYYCYTVNNYLAIYKDYTDYLGLDLEKSFSEQIYDAEAQMTWQDFFSDLTNAMLQTSETLYRQSCEDNYKPTNKIYNEFLNSIKEQAKTDNRSYENFLQNMFVETMTPKVFEEQLYRYCTSVEYSEYLKEKIKTETTDEQLEEFYTNNTKYYDTVDYHIFCLPYSEDAEVDDEDSDVLTKETAKLRADKVAAATSEENFHQLVLENALKNTIDLYKPKNSTKTYTTSITSDTSQAGIWLYDDARKYGDVTVIDYNSAYYVLYFVNRYRNNDDTVTFRHILLTTDNYETSEKLSETANTMYEYWVSLGATEKMFTEYANDYSEDTKDNGLYENVAKGTTIEEIDSWLYDKNRTYGDHIIIGNDTEYHLLFFIKVDEPRWKVSARKDYTTEKYNEYIDSIISNYQLEFISGEKYNSADNIKKSENVQ